MVNMNIMYGEEVGNGPGGMRGRPVQVLAVGGGGLNELGYLVRQGISGFRSIALDTDQRRLIETGGAATIKIPMGLREGTCGGCQGSALAGRRAAEHAGEAIQTVLEAGRCNIIVAALGGGTGSGAAPLIARWSTELGIETQAAVSLPIRFEGERRRKRALLALKHIRKYISGVRVVELDDMFTSLPGRLTMSQGFRLKGLSPLVREILSSKFIVGDHNGTGRP